MNIISTVGKVKESVLKRSVLKELTLLRKKQAAPSGIGEDGTCFLMSEGQPMTVATAAMEGCGTEFVSCVFYRALNNILVKHAIPYGMTVSVMLRTGAEEAELKEIMRTLVSACEEHGLVLIGGETMSCKNSLNTGLSITMFGRGGSEYTKEATPGLEIIMAGQAAKAATVLAIKERKDELKSRFSSAFLEEGEQLVHKLSIASIMETEELKDAVYCHDISDGGVFAALWETGEALKSGLSVVLPDLLIAQQTIEICEVFDWNPYQMFSLGAVIIVTEHGSKLVRKLQEKGIPAAIIGELTESKDRILKNEEETRFLEPFKGHEID